MAEPFADRVYQRSANHRCEHPSAAGEGGKTTALLDEHMKLLIWCDRALTRRGDE